MFKTLKSFIAKSFGATTTCTIAQLIYGTGSARVNLRQAYNYFDRNGPLRDAVDKISNAIADLPLVIAEEGADEFITDSAFLDLLNEPGAENSHNQFFIELVTSFLLTEEAWFVARGTVTREPLALAWLKPFDVNPTFSRQSGFPERIETTSPRDRREYLRQEVDGQFRYFDREGLNEIIPIIGQTDADTQFRGTTRLNAIKDDLDQQIEGGTHNKALIKNSINPSGVFAPESDNVPDEALDKVTDSLQNKHTQEGAGSSMVLPFGIKMISKDMTNRDMDFVNLMDRADVRIYNQYEIPLPLIMARVMTMANFEGAQVAFYDRAVNTTFSMIADGLMETIGRRFGLENQKLTFNPHAVKPLQSRQALRMKDLRASGALSTDEIRQTAGYENVSGGDSVLAPATLVPIGNGATFDQAD